jgi:hypothetical protein
MNLLIGHSKAFMLANRVANGMHGMSTVKAILLFDKLM